MTTESQVRKRLIVALDLADPSRARTLATVLAPEVGMFKVGKQLYVSAGPDIVRTIHELGGEVFLDLKFHDISNTVAAAAVEAARLGVRLFNVHASGGPEMMRQTAAAVEKVCGEEGLRRPSVLGVTVLTSLDDSDLETLGIQGGVRAQVLRLAGMVREAGLAGVVCSAQEAADIRRACGDGFLLVTPGIRPAGEQAGDQKRIMTPGDAVRAGIDYIVVGRPITGADDPADAARMVVAEMAEAAG